MTHLYRIADRVLNRPLLIHPDKLELIASVLGGRIGIDIGHIDPQANRYIGLPDGQRDADGARKTGYRFQRVDDAAIITVDGSLVNRGAWIGADSSGLQSYEGIGGQIIAAAKDPNIRSIVLDIDSAGGEAGGMFDLAGRIRAIAQEKAVVAFVNDMAASAAYGLASAATQVVATETAVTGSIGVVMLHLDRSAEMESLGRKPTLIFAGAKKIDGNAFEPLTEEVRADLQSEVDQLYGLFLDAVAAGRGERLDAAAARATEAGVFIGRDGIAAGLADDIGNIEKAIKIARDLGVGRNTVPAGSAGRSGMTKPGPVPATGPSKRGDDMEYDDITAAGLEEHRPDLVEMLMARGREAAARESDDAISMARAEGAAAERDRISAIQALDPHGDHRNMVAQLVADGTAPGDAAVQILNAANAARSAALDRLGDASASLGEIGSGANASGTSASPPADGAKTAEDHKAAYAGSPALQSEFPTAEAYAAYMTAQAKGRVRILTNRSAA